MAIQLNFVKIEDINFCHSMNTITDYNIAYDTHAFTLGKL